MAHYLCHLTWVFLIFIPTNVQPAGNDYELRLLVNNYNGQLKKINLKYIKAAFLGNKPKLLECRRESKNLIIEAFTKFSRVDTSQITSPSLARQITLFKNMGTETLPSKSAARINDFSTEIDITKQIALRSLKSQLNAVESAGQNVDVYNEMIQAVWTESSINLATQIRSTIIAEFEFIEQTASTAGMDTVEFWHYIQGYGTTFDENKIMNMWTYDLRANYVSLYSFIKHDMISSNKLAHHTKNDPLVAYYYDKIARFSFFGNLAEEPYYNSLLKSTVLTDRIHHRYMHGSYDLVAMAINAQEFYESLRFPSLNPKFWEQSSFRTELDNKSLCRISEDFISTDLYKFQATCPMNYHSYVALHRKLYQLNRKLIIEETSLPEIFKQLEFMPFHNALEHAIIMSATSYKRIKELGFFFYSDIVYDLTMLTLRQEAIADFTTLASALALDTWKSDVMRKKVRNENLFCQLWNRRLHYEGVIPGHPVYFRESIHAGKLYDSYAVNSYDSYSDKDFDSNTDMNINTEYNYSDFMTVILKYQIFDALCLIAGQFDPNNPNNVPLHLCDFSGNRAVAEKIMEVLRLGASETWQQLLWRLTDRYTDINTESFLRYFQPVLELIESDNMKNDAHIGWNDQIDFCETISNMWFRRVNE